MVLVGWLDEVLRDSNWYVPQVSSSNGLVCNVHFTDVNFQGTWNGEHHFIGRLSIPKEHLQMCCIRSEGKQHICDKTRVQDERILAYLHVPEDTLLSIECSLIESLSIRGAKSEGQMALDQIQSGHHCVCFDQKRVLPVEHVGIGSEQVPTVFSDDEIFWAFGVIGGETSLHLTPKEWLKFDDGNEQFTLLELFAGGFAGWHRAAEIMATCHVKWASTLAVEIDRCVAQVYANNHVSQMYDCDDPFFREGVSLKSGHVVGSQLFRGSVLHPGFARLMPWMHRVITAISSPCPPWSAASEKNGLNHEDGRLLVRVAAVMRFIQPEAIVVEQVHTFREHEHFKCVIDTFRWSGFHLAWETIEDLKTIAPVVRKRWLGLFLKKGVEFQHVGTNGFVQMPETNLGQFRTFIQLPEEHENELLLNDDLKLIYGDPLLYKGKSVNGGRFRPMTPKDVLEARTRNVFSVMSTIMAMYGSQHEIPRHKLAVNGLFTELARGSKGYRFFSPFECAILHCVNGCFQVPAGSRIGHHVVGNCISVPHAILVLAAARNVVDPRNAVDPTEMVLFCLKHRLHAENASIRQVGGEWILIPDGGCKHVPRHLSVHDVDPTCIDTEDEVSLDTTVSFNFEFQVTVTSPDGIKQVFFVPLGYTVDSFMSLHELNDVSTQLIITDDEQRILPLDHQIEGDLHIVQKWDNRVYRDVVTKRASWFVCEAEQSVIETMKCLGVHHFDLKAWDSILRPIRDLEQRVPLRRIILISDDLGLHFPTWIPEFGHPKDLFELVATVESLLPRFVDENEKIMVVANGMDERDEVAVRLQHYLAPLLPVLSAIGWMWDSELTTEQFNKGVLGAFVPANECASPMVLVVLPVLRNFISGLLSHPCLSGGKPVKIKFDGLLIWEGCLDPDIEMAEFSKLVLTVLEMCGYSSCRLVVLGRQCFHFCLSKDLTDGTVVLNFIMPVHGGGGKVDGWREVKSVLAKELIQHGWPVHGLDEVTTDWCQRIGVNKLLNHLKIPGSEKRWSVLIDTAKWYGLGTVPEDPVKLKAVRTIQVAMRKTINANALAVSVSICPGYFHLQNDQPAAILEQLDLKSAGVCLMDFDNASNWLKRDLPLVSDELAIVTVFQDKIPPGYPKSIEVTFPALDSKGRQSLVRGLLWQLGEQHIKLSPHGKTITTDATLVLACTIWRDECGDKVWSDVAKSMVKTCFGLLSEVDTANKVLQVWGRGFRDAFAKADPESAWSAQFHMRIFRKDAEEFLRASGKGPVYLTPKCESHLSHPDWAMIWVHDKVAATIGCDKVSNHSGIGRSKNKFAVRVAFQHVEQAAKEIKPSDPPKSTMPVQMLFKVEPLPVGTTPTALCAWAESLKWKVKVLKLLGRQAALVGANVPPPFQHMSINDKPVLIRQIKSRKGEGLKSNIVAGPKPQIQRTQETEKFAEGRLLSDPWAQYLGGSASTSPSVTSHASNPVQRSVDAPTAARFTAIEERLAKFEGVASNIVAEQKNMAQDFQKQEAAVQEKLNIMDKKISGMNASFTKSMESTIQNAMVSQERKLDSKFQELINMMTGGGQVAKRKNGELEDDEDAAMDSPEKPAPVKR